MQTQTLAELANQIRVKFKMTNVGYEATVKGDTPHDVLQLVADVHDKAMALRHNPKAIGDASGPEDLPYLVRDHDSGGYLVMHGGGFATPFNPELVQLDEDYRIKVDVTLNTKGHGFTVAVKGVSVEEAIAVSRYVEADLNHFFRTYESSKMELPKG